MLTFQIGKALFQLTIDQMALALIGYLSIYLAVVNKNQKLALYAPVVGMLGQPFWIYATLSKELYGMTLVCVGYTFIYALGIRRSLMAWFGEEK